MLEIGNDQKSPAAIEAATSHFCSCFALSIPQQLGGATRHQGHKFCRYRYHSSSRSRRTARKPLDPDQRCRSTAAKSGAWHQDGFPTSRLPGSPPSFSAWLCSPSPCCPLGERGLRRTCRSLATACRAGYRHSSSRSRRTASLAGFIDLFGSPRVAARS